MVSHMRGKVADMNAIASYVRNMMPSFLKTAHILSEFAGRINTQVMLESPVLFRARVTR